jgi:hypothetical protein
VSALAPDAFVVFVARAEARALLWRADELALADAVDDLLLAADFDGLTAKVGEGALQAIVAWAFACVCDGEGSEPPLDAWSAPSWREAALEYQRERCAVGKIELERLARLRALLANNVSLERAWHELNEAPHVAAATLEAAEHLMRAGNAERLQAWLGRQTASARAAILHHLQRQVVP